MTANSTEDRKRRGLEIYGRTEVGQVVKYSRNALVSDMRTVADPQWISSVLTVVRLQESDSGAIVTLRSETEEFRFCIDAYGQRPGGFSGLSVVQEAPRQTSLRLEAAA